MADMRQWTRVFPWMKTGFEIDGKAYAASMQIVRRSNDPDKDDSDRLRRMAGDDRPGTPRR
jgi:hypothetical protein